MNRSAISTPRREFGLLAPAIVAFYLAALAYLAWRALKPSAAADWPAWAAWFGAPGSFATILIVLGVPIGYLGIRRYQKRRTPGSLVLIGAMAASALALALAGYWNCHGDQSPLFSPLAWALALFAGNVENPFPDGPPNCTQMPVAVELARLLAIATTLTTAITAVLSMSRSQLDRVAIWRARKLVVVVGIDNESIPLLQAISRSLLPRDVLTVLTKNTDPAVNAAIRHAGGRIRNVDLDADGELASLPIWSRLERLYLLSNDPARNVSRYGVIDKQMAALPKQRTRLLLTVRIDDPWQAEVWRRSFLAQRDRRWVADAIGRFELTATELVKHIAANREAAPTKTVVICGLSQLTPALTSELAQARREYAIYPRPGANLPESAVVVAHGATGFIEDHQLRQQRMAESHGDVALSAVDTDPSVEAISEVLRDVDPASVAVILCASAADSATTGTRLALRFPGMKIYQHVDTATNLTSTSVIGHLYTFPITLNITEGTPQDAWERAAEIIHESYSQTSNRDTPATQEWKKLDAFWKGSNRRLVINTLWMVEKDTGLTWDSLDSPPESTLPADFAELSAAEQLRALGLDEAAVEHMIATEHADWCRYYDGHGWTYSPDRDDNRRKHPMLKDWDKLMAEPEADKHRQKALRSLAGTLITLRNLGYRAVPQRTHR